MVRIFGKPAHTTHYQSQMAQTEGLDPTKLYALIIGNNEYSKYPKSSLTGAVADARNFCNFLIEIKVPTNHIRLIENAKYKDMNDALAILKKGQLQTDSGELVLIPKGSAFVLFYAGHGGRVPIPDSWKKAGYHTADDKVELLVPTDISESDGDDDTIKGIPDRFVAGVLKGLVNEIGDNVVSSSI
jgi:hypothetical protein